MAIITDQVIPAHSVPESYVRNGCRIKLNGPGGQFPSATIDVGDLIHSAFKKNGSTWQPLQDSYQITVAPAAGKQLIAYYVLRIVEEDLP